jgi:hypothetical protein
LFSSDPRDAEDEPFFWQYHHTAPAWNQSLAGSHTANKDSIYRAGGLTEVFTVWSLLLTDGGDQILDDPVTKYLPELVDDTKDQDAIGHVAWHDVTVGQLASHMSGVARDCTQNEQIFVLLISANSWSTDCSKDGTLQESFSEARLPTLPATQKPCCGNCPKCSGSGMEPRFMAGSSMLISSQNSFDTWPTKPLSL